MNDVNIYVETDTRSPRARTGHYAFVLEMETKSGIQTATEIGCMENVTGGHISGHGPDQRKMQGNDLYGFGLPADCIPAGLAAWMAGTGMEECKGAGYQKRGSVEPDPVYGR